MLVAAPPQFHYTLFCPPSAKILKETLGWLAICRVQVFK